MAKDPELNIDSTKPTEINSSVVNFLSDGGEATTLVTGLIGGLITSMFVSLGQVINSVGDFIGSPFEGGAEAISKLTSGLLTSPITILDTTALQSAESIAAQFGWLAFPVGVATVLVVLWMVNMYREQQETGDTIVGLPFDVPDVGPLQIGTTEENEDEQ